MIKKNGSWYWQIDVKDECILTCLVKSGLFLRYIYPAKLPVIISKLANYPGTPTVKLRKITNSYIFGNIF